MSNRWWRCIRNPDQYFSSHWFSIPPHPQHSLLISERDRYGHFASLGTDNKAQWYIEGTKLGHSHTNRNGFYSEVDEMQLLRRKGAAKERVCLYTVVPCQHASVSFRLVTLISKNNNDKIIIIFLKVLGADQGHITVWVIFHCVTEYFSPCWQYSSDQVTAGGKSSFRTQPNLLHPRRSSPNPLPEELKICSGTSLTFEWWTATEIEKVFWVGIWWLLLPLVALHFHSNHTFLSRIWWKRGAAISSRSWLLHKK